MRRTKPTHAPAPNSLTVPSPTSAAPFAVALIWIRLSASACAWSFPFERISSAVNTQNRSSRRRLRAGFVRPLLWYYGAVRLPEIVHVRCAANCLSGPSRGLRQRSFQGLPVSVHRVSTHAQGLRLRDVKRAACDCRRRSCCLPHISTRSARRNSDFGAQWLACVCPCQRFTRRVTMTGVMTQG